MSASALCLFLVVVLSLIPSSAAAFRTTESNITLSIKGEPLETVLPVILRGVPYEMGPGVSADTLVSVQIKGATRDAALAALLSSAGLAYRQTAGKILISKQQVVSLVVNGSHFGNALSALNSAAGLSYQIGGGVDVSREVSGAFKDVPMRDILRVLAAQLDYDIEEPSPGTYRVVAVAEKKFFLPVLGIARDYKSVVGGETLGAAAGGAGTTGTTAGSGVTGGGTAGGGDQTKLSAEVKLEVTSKTEVWKVIERNIKSLISKNGTVMVDAEHSFVSVRDAVANVRQVEAYLENVREVWSRQVEFDVMILEISDLHNMDYGLDWNKVFQVVKFGGGLVTLGSRPTGAVSRSTQAGRVGFAAGRDDLLIRALEEQGKVKVINRPKIRVLSHQPVTLTSAVLEPYISSIQQTVQSQGTTTGSATLTRAASGLSLGLLPIVDGDEIALTIQPIVNDITRFREFTVFDTIIENPTINNRAVSTVARVTNGETIVLADYERTNDSDTVRGLPFIARIPILGAIFGGYEGSKGRKHMVITLTTRIVGTGSSLMAPNATVGVEKREAR